MMTDRWNSLRELIISCRGASAVEFAVVFPLLLVILFGVIEFGLLMFNKQVITNASREGARAGIVMQTPRLACGEITAVVQNYCDQYLISFPNNSTVETRCYYNNTPPPNDPEWNRFTGTPTASFGNDLKIVTLYEYNFLALSALSALFPFGSIPDMTELMSFSAMRYE
jgi:Flp pilus assembly protein TadG